MTNDEMKKVIIVVKYDGEKFVAFPTKPKGFAVPPRGEGVSIEEAVADLVRDLIVRPAPIFAPAQQCATVRARYTGYEARFAELWEAVEVITKAVELLNRRINHLEHNQLPIIR